MEIEMSGDEIFVGLVCAAVAGWRWWRWFARVNEPSPMLTERATRWPVNAAPIVAAVALFAVLRFWASADVRDDGRYLAFYLAMGLAWVGIFAAVLPLLGINLRDDAVERANRAASYAAAAAVVALMLCFAGANIGDGPGWWVVVFCAALSTGGLIVLWLLVGEAGRGVEAIVVDRDEASALRLAGFLVASGLVLGRAAAGDWKSAEAAVADFATAAWPLVILAACAIAIDRVARPTPENPRPSPAAAGVIPAAVYVAAAAVYIAMLGPW